jgi:hypothetical protein
MTPPCACFRRCGTRTEHLAEHGESGVGEDRFHLAREHDERRQAAMRVETRDVAWNEDSDFPGDRRVTCAVNTLLAICADAETTHGLQPFDDPGEVFLRRLLGPFPQPHQRRPSLFVVDGEQGLQTGDGLLGYPLDEIFVRPLASESTRRQRILSKARREGSRMRLWRSCPIIAETIAPPRSEPVACSIATCATAR